MPPTRTYHQRSFTPFPIAYTSESFAPLVREDRQIAYVRYLLRGQHAALACFRHYLTDCSTIFALEQTLQELRDSRNYVFANFTTPDVIYRLQPFLIQSRRRLLAPFPLLPLPLLPVPVPLLLNLLSDDLKNTSLRYNSRKHTMTTYRLSLPSPMSPPSPLPSLFVPPHRFQPPTIVSFGMFLPSSLGSTLVAVVGRPTTIFLDAPTEVRVFRS